MVSTMDWQSSLSGVQTPLPSRGCWLRPRHRPHSISHHHRHRQWMGGVPRPRLNFQPRKASCFSHKNTGHWHTCSSAPRPATGTAGGREPHLLLVFPLGGSNWRLQGGSRLHGCCGKRPKPVFHALLKGLFHTGPDLPLVTDS